MILVDIFLLYLLFPDFKWVLFVYIFKKVVFLLNLFVFSKQACWYGNEMTHRCVNRLTCWPVRAQMLAKLPSCPYTQISDLFILLYKILPEFVLFRLDYHFGNTFKLYYEKFYFVPVCHRCISFFFQATQPLTLAYSQAPTFL